MTYSGFLLFFLIIPVLILFTLTWRHSHKSFWIAVLVHMILAVVYTTPWDNYLVATHVWYYDPKLISGIVLGYVPLEEYTFFLLQTLSVGLWWQFVAQRTALVADFKPSLRLRAFSVILAALIWIGAAFVFLIRLKQMTYLSIILFWAIPPIIPQLYFGADILWHQRKLLVWTILPVGLYLSLADSLAIESGTWTINPAQSTGIFIGKLPLEEAVFFFATVTLLSFGITLLMEKESRVRWMDIKGSVGDSKASYKLKSVVTRLIWPEGVKRY